MKLFTGIEKMTGYTATTYTNENDRADTYEYTDWHRPEGSHIQVQVKVETKGGRIDSATLIVKPDGYWTEVVTAQVDNIWKKQPIRTSIRNSSGGTTSEDKTYQNGDVNIGVKDEIERTQYFIEGLQYATQFAAWYKMKFEHEATNGATK